MPKLDWDTIDDAEDYSPLPDGQYPCVLADVKEKNTQYGDEMWNLEFLVADGGHEGRKIFDNLVFSEKALKRAKLVCSRLGLDVTGQIELTPDMLKGRTCLITVGTEAYVDDEGRDKKRNVVPFAGYDRIETAVTRGAVGDDVSEEDVPF